MSLMYPSPANSWRIYPYYLVRLKDVLVRHIATVWRLMRGDRKARVDAANSYQVTTLRDWLMSD